MNTIQGGTKKPPALQHRNTHTDINTQDLTELLTALLLEDATTSDLTGETVDVSTFEEAGVLTNNDGLVVRVGNREFQLTVVQSR